MEINWNKGGNEGWMGKEPLPGGEKTLHKKQTPFKKTGRYTPRPWLQKKEVKKPSYKGKKPERKWVPTRGPYTEINGNGKRAK